jgi:hypothetical protein
MTDTGVYVLRYKYTDRAGNRSADRRVLIVHNCTAEEMEDSDNDGDPDCLEDLN